jgi:hypothetical protein
MKDQNNKKIQMGDSVEVPDPEDPIAEGYDYSFIGTVVDLRDKHVTVEDGDGDCFDIDADKLLVLEW